MEAGKQISKILRLEEQPIGEPSSNKLVRNVKGKQAEAVRSTKHPATAANPKP